MLDKITIEKINGLRILDVADRLQIKYSSNGTWRKALCFCHDDHTPSLGIKPADNRWKCFVCGKGGSHIDLVMEHENLNFNDACEWLIREFNIPVPQQETHQTLLNAIKSKLMNYSNSNDGSINHTPSTINHTPSTISHTPSTINPSLLERFKGTSNEFTRALVQTGILTQEQVNHAAEAYRLSTADDSVIFWQIDLDDQIREGKVMYYQADAHRSHSRKPVSVSWLLKQEKLLPADWTANHCLFGLHLLHDDGDDRIIAIVESEKTAIICSELLPALPSPINHKPLTFNHTPSTINHKPSTVTWLATGGKSNLTVENLRPLNGRIIIFPDTDPTGITYHEWLKTAQDASKKFGHPLTVSNILELHATEDQKRRKIDIADFIIEGREKDHQPSTINHQL